MPPSASHTSTERAPASIQDATPLDGAGSSVDVSVVIVNYNVKDFLSQALRSVEQASEGLRVETFVVDNNSIDDSVAMVRRDYPEVRMMANQENVGFGRANNQAILEASGRHVLILNPDTIVQEDALRTMVAFMDDHPECGALGCQILNPDGSFAPESRRSFPSPQIAFYRMTGLSTLFPKSKRFGQYNRTFVPRDQDQEVDALSGSCMMVRRTALLGPDPQVDGKSGSGLFDEDFFMYGEDLDLCYRIKKAGWQVWYTAATQIIHYKGESTKKGELKYVRLFYGAMLLFIEKHLEFQHSAALTSALRAGIVVRAFITLLGNWMRMASPLIKDFAGVYATVAALGSLRFWQTGVESSPLFYATVAPVFALATVLGIAMMGGYRSTRKWRIEPVFTGVIVGFLFVASLAYFVQAIAFSRLVVGLSVPVSFGVLMLWRSFASRKRRGLRRALLVGEKTEADRLSNLLTAHPRPPFTLKGYVSDAVEPVESVGDGDVRHLGRRSHLRDLVRLRGFEDIVFASSDIPNHVIFGIMKDLKDLPVQFRMLQEGQEYVIGKSTISHLSIGSLQADVTEVVEIRSPFSKALFEKSLSLVLLPLVPFIWVAWRLSSPDSPRRKKLKPFLKLHRVLSGNRALVGCRKKDLPFIPENWNVPVGIFPVTNTMRTKELKSEDIARVYWYYVTHQTPGLDLEILIASLRSS
jgi:GT2 family glycosyltransferase